MTDKNVSRIERHNSYFVVHVAILAGSNIGHAEVYVVGYDVGLVAVPAKIFRRQSTFAECWR